MGKLIEDPALRDRIHVFMDRAHAGRLLAERLLGVPGPKGPPVRHSRRRGAGGRRDRPGAWPSPWT